MPGSKPGALGHLATPHRKTFPIRIPRHASSASSKGDLAAPATIADFVSGTVLGNAFEPVLRRRQPRVDVVLAELSRHGQACLTGTGGGCFVEFGSQSQARAAASALPAGWRSEVVAGASRSPLLDALEQWR